MWRYNGLLMRHVEVLRDAVRELRRKRPFDIVAWAVLPDHMHCIWILLPGGVDYATRWRLIKADYPTTHKRRVSRYAIQTGSRHARRLATIPRSADG